MTTNKTNDMTVCSHHTRLLTRSYTPSRLRISQSMSLHSIGTVVRIEMRERNYEADLKTTTTTKTLFVFIDEKHTIQLHHIHGVERKPGQTKGDHQDEFLTLDVPVKLCLVSLSVHTASRKQCCNIT